MKALHWIFVASFAIVGILLANMIQPTVAQQQAGSGATAQQPQFEYATLTETATEEGAGTVYLATWNNGPIDIIGRSTNSMQDAQRRLSPQLGGLTDSRTNLGMLLTAIGQDGWRLVESTGSDTGITRVFIRVAR